MTHEEFVERSAQLKAEMESETHELEQDLARARAKAERLEARLNGVRELFQRRSVALINAYMGIAGEAGPPEASLQGAAAEQKKRRALDAPVLELTTEIAAPEVTASQVEMAWNQRHPESRLTSSTVRGILDRLAEQGKLLITDPGGGRGSGVPRKYRPA